MDGSASPVRHTPILIVGCGFGGLALTIALKKAGISDFTILERAAGPGGVWRDNSYPGAACDVVSRLYSLSGDQDHDWSQAFAPQAEILAYYRRCFDRHGVAPHVRFNTEVRRASFDAASATWTITANTGETWRTPIFVSAVGLFNQPIIPEIPGRDSFKGKQFHSAGWDHSYKLAGKRVAVLGSGASAVQFVPHVAEEAEKLHLFIRTPQYVFPKTFFPGTSSWDAWLQKHPRLRWLARLKIYLMFERFIFRRRFFPEMRKLGEEGFRQLLAQKVADPELRRKLTPDYPLGCKRVLVSDRFIDAVIRPNTEVVTTKIARILPDGIETADGRVYKVDAIIYGTGFKPTEYLTPMRIYGLGGRDLKDVWREGAEAHLGITIAGFPNFFLMYGPHTNAITSIIFMLECQARYIAQCARTIMRHGGYMNVREDAQRKFIAETQARLSRTIPALAICHTYAKQENGRITTQWPGYATEYRRRTSRVRMSDFDFVAATAPAKDEAATDKIAAD
jgi:cation diffusion facilitator CzcD-associated flavoprotein CzcO